MRGRKTISNQVRMGRTIVGEREYAESESERMQARKKVHRRRTTSVIIVFLMMVALGLMGYIGMKEMVKPVTETEPQVTPADVQAQIVDEDARGRISSRMMRYIAQLEGDLKDLGYTLKKVTLPTGKSRELYLDVEGSATFYKVNTDRETALVAEDIDRMARYLKVQNLTPEYVDVRIEGKAYYK